MNYQEKSEEIISQLKGYVFNMSLTDGHKSIVSVIFKLSIDIPDLPYIIVKSQAEYNLITKYIIKVVDYKNFKYNFEMFEGASRYLSVLV